MPGYFRQQVFKRDGGVCAGCGKDCGKGARLAGRRTNLLGAWEADHVVALDEGGSGGLENAQTLCGGRRSGCHYRKTTEHAARRAAKRRAATADGFVITSEGSGEPNRQGVSRS
jgi:5-methylcytosine-specific restriction endonuclease McrA